MPKDPNNGGAHGACCQLKPGRYDLPYEVGETLLQRGRQFAPGYEELEQSIRWFEQSIEAWPSHAFAYLLKGHALDSLGRMAEADLIITWRLHSSLKAALSGPIGAFMKSKRRPGGSSCQI